MFTQNNNGFPTCMKIVDLGCASGPNTLFLISHILDTIKDLCNNYNLKNLPQLEVFLNDLPQNDFNNLFKLNTDFSRENGKERKIECFVYGVPASFYGRLFPTNSLHFAYSSFSVHWLSQIPEGLGKNNNENIYIAPNSPPQVCEAYAKQFQKDFSRFLSLRSEEITSGGRMVLAFVGRNVVAKYVFQLLAVLGETLSDMVAQVITNYGMFSITIHLLPYHPCMESNFASEC
ncbi:benzoate carboxyl methyltransferase [Phtheirospermum japonicum]|uniref:Benzoate carboxyl methyltransferase n=1 Tax=Phtheirospermum japonicum TaxID=374723 RepID=A0A830D4H3_9LAMI|nr:benzoate carboxyl methyltransferase [Phtheirospermum japonicum]